MNNTILVIREYLNCEENLLMTKEAFIEYVDGPFIHPTKDMTDVLIGLGRTINKDQPWEEIHMNDDTFISVRFCFGEKQLFRFMNGDFNNDNKRWSFNKEESSPSCIEHWLKLSKEEQPIFEPSAKTTSYDLEHKEIDKSCSIEK